jgi:MtN3 and saliva related transmembrane protein
MFYLCLLSYSLLFMNPEIVGISAGVLSCTTFLPQVVKTWRSKSTRDVSLTMFIIAAVGTCLWLVYGLMINSISIVFTNCIVLALSLIMLYLFYHFRKNQ